MSSTPRIVVTVAEAARQPEPDLAERKNALYLDAIRRHGGQPVALDAASTGDERRAALAGMDGLLLTGGADIDPASYGALPEGATGTQPDRDELEQEAWAAAEARGVPVLGICRGMQAMNVFSGGRLLQHVEGHRGAEFGHGPAATHPLRVLPGTRLARILFPANVGGGALTVNSYHHQAIRRADLAPGFVPSAISPSPAGELIEAMEQPGGRFRMAVQCHPERQESTPAAFERLFAFFLDSCRGPAQRR
jgi:putative glutamine amidotransferase